MAALSGHSEDKPRIAVSACLLGQKVRYDGGHQYNPVVVEVLGAKFELIALCPESAAGLGVPRPPVRLVQLDAETRAIGVDNPELDVTVDLQCAADSFGDLLASCDGLVVKSRSPSCGLDDAPLFNNNGGELARVSGLFTVTVQRHYPHLPVVSEAMLNDTQALDHFARAVRLLFQQRNAG